jgi:lycopene beta-cyclase
MTSHPVLILGGGLWGGLLASRWHELYPDIPFLLVEKGSTFGGNHTWSFHTHDLGPSSFEWIKPFIAKSWPRYEVRFPEYTKTFELGYNSITSSQFHAEMINKLPPQKFRLAHNVSIEDALASAEWVIDARGYSETVETGWQKFLGLEVLLENSHHVKQPILMDATIPQSDGLRFLYELPFDENRILLELTSYSNDPVINEQEYRNTLLEICKKRKWIISSVLRTEKSSLPIPLTKVTVSESARVVQLGGLFHDTTGYSLPDAVRVIDCLLTENPAYFSFKSKLQTYRDSRVNDRAFFRMLNRLMFRAADNESRYKMLQFFYKHDVDLISHFYSGQLKFTEKLKFFLGKPPVSIVGAVKEIIR